MNKELTALLEAMKGLFEESPQLYRTVERAILLSYKVGITDTWDIVHETYAKQLDAMKLEDSNEIGR